MFFIFKQKTAYEMRISDWSSDVCSSDLTSATDQSTDLPVLQHQDHLRFRVHPRKMQPVSARPRTLLPPRCETHPVPGPDRQQCRLSALMLADFEERRPVLATVRSRYTRETHPKQSEETKTPDLQHATLHTTNQHQTKPQ